MVRVKIGLTVFSGCLLTLLSQRWGSSRVVNVVMGFITQEMWCSNQICDLFAKDADTANQISSFDRGRLVHNLAQLTELLLYLGRLTHEVNHFSAADGTIIRDSTAEQGLAARRRKSLSGHGQSGVAQAKGARSPKAKVRRAWPLDFKTRAGPL